MENENATLIVGADSDIGSRVIAEIGGGIVAHYFAFPDKVEKRDRLAPVYGDLSSVGGIESFIKEVSDLGKNINKIVFLPSGPATPARFKDFSAKSLERDMNIAVMSAALVFKAFLPEMSKRRFGRIAAILTSYCIGVPPKFLTNYITSKYALMGLLKSLAAEYASRGITVNAVAPSMTETKFLTLPGFEIEANAKANPTGRNATVDDIAPVIAMLIDDKNEFMTGAVIPITGGSQF